MHFCKAFGISVVGVDTAGYSEFLIGLARRMPDVRQVCVPQGLTVTRDPPLRPACTRFEHFLIFSGKLGFRISGA